MWVDIRYGQTRMRGPAIRSPFVCSNFKGLARSRESFYWLVTSKIEWSLSRYLRSNGLR